MRPAELFDGLEHGAPDDDGRQELAAAALVLRIVAHEFAGETVLEAEIAEARHAVLRVGDVRTHTRLRDLLSDVTAGERIEESWRDTLSLDLLAYGEELRARGLVAAAAALLDLVAEGSQASAELRLDASLRRAFCLRLLGSLDDATAQYRKVEELATFGGFDRQRLEAQLGIARVAINRGNIPQAEPLIDAAIASARAAGLSSVLGKALIDKAAIAGIRRDASGVLVSSYKALEFVETAAGRDRIFINMATAFRELGRAESARRLAHEVLSRPCDADQRAAAMVLLYHLAIDVGDRRTSAMYRRALTAVPLLPAMLAEKCEAVARDAAARGEWESAHNFAEQMIAIADEHQLAELSFRGAFAMESIRGRRVPAVYQFQPVPPANAEQYVVEIEQELDALCSASAD